MKRDKRKYLCPIFALLLSVLTFSSACCEEGTTEQNDRITGNAFGIEFWGKIAGEGTFTKDNVVFGGRGDHPLTETQKVNVDIDTRERYYDIGIFYRLKRVKMGWIPTRLDKHYSRDVVYYHQPFGEWPLGGYDVNVETYNMGYLEVYGLHAKNTYANLALRLDRSKVNGELLTYKYPYGDEWYQEKKMINRESLDEKSYILSIGPKVDYNFDIPCDSPLTYFKGVDLMVLYDIPIGGYKNVEGYSVSLSLVLEF